MQGNITSVLGPLSRRLVRWVFRRLLRGDSYHIKLVTTELLTELHAVHAERFYEDNAATRRIFMAECLERARVPN